MRQVIQSARYRKALTMERAAQLVGINAAYWSLIENGHREPSLKVARMMAKVLGRPIGALFDDAM